MEGPDQASGQISYYKSTTQARGKVQAMTRAARLTDANRDWRPYYSANTISPMSVSSTSIGTASIQID